MPGQETRRHGTHEVDSVRGLRLRKYGVQHEHVEVPGERRPRPRFPEDRREAAVEFARIVQDHRAEAPGNEPDSEDREATVAGHDAEVLVSGYTVIVFFEDFKRTRRYSPHFTLCNI